MKLVDLEKGESRNEKIININDVETETSLNNVDKIQVEKHVLKLIRRCLENLSWCGSKHKLQLPRNSGNSTEKTCHMAS